MIDTDAIEYAQARLQARFGARPRAAAWQKIATIREQRALFEMARATAFRPLVAGLAPDQPVHDLEAGLRARWRARAREVTGWLPGPWQRAAAWFSVLPDLPVIEHLLRGGTPYTWMRGDSMFGALSESDPSLRQQALAGGALAELDVDFVSDTNPSALAEAWIAALRRRLPEAADDEALHLRSLGHLLHEYRQAIVTAHPGEAIGLRRSLTERLEGLFRRAALTPIAGYCYLAITALDFLRLRGEIVRRAALPRLSEAA